MRARRRRRKWPMRWPPGSARRPPRRAQGDASTRHAGRPDALPVKARRHRGRDGSPAKSCAVAPEAPPARSVPRGSSAPVRAPVRSPTRGPPARSNLPRPAWKGFPASTRRRRRRARDRRRGLAALHHPPAENRRSPRRSLLPGPTIRRGRRSRRPGPTSISRDCRSSFGSCSSPASGPPPPWRSRSSSRGPDTTGGEVVAAHPSFHSPAASVSMAVLWVRS